MGKEVAVIEIWARYQGGEWELIDQFEPGDVQAMLAEYKLAYGPGWKWELREAKS